MDIAAERNVDLRSDAITRPTAAMWDAMRAVELGWASAGEDAALHELEATGAELAGKEAALYVLTGGMANLVALMTHTTRGDQVVMDALSHVLWCEEWGLAYVCGLVPRAVEGERGQMRADDVAFAINDALYRHRPHTSLVWLENTDNTYGEAASASYLREVAAVAHELGAATHLDGARVLNACVELDVELHDMLAGADSAMISLNKGLSAPGGALLVGTSDFIAKARLNVRRLGGSSFHQCGIHAAAGLIALREMPPQLADDSRRASALAEALSRVEGLTVDRGGTATNMVIVVPDPAVISATGLVAGLDARGVRAYLSREHSVRFVTHRHVSDEDIAYAAQAAVAVTQGCTTSRRETHGPRA
jgi:threonine aldolase